MKNHYNLIVIGAGPAGTPAAMAAAQFGNKVLLIDKRNAPGGECLFEGCIPSKVLENAANHYAQFVDVNDFHIELSGKAQIHWKGVLKDKDIILKQRSMSALKQIKMLPTLDYLQGLATFVDANTILVNEKLFSFDKALIASGGKSFLPHIKGNGVEKAWINRDVFFEEKIPKELIFIGAGAISCELAQMFNKLGTHCHILERSERILKKIDEDTSLIVQKEMIKNGIVIDLNVKLETINYENNKFIVNFMQNDKEETLECEHLLMATGRIANTQNLGLEEAGVIYDSHAINVNEKLQTTQPHIYACGDCIDGPHFAHTATYEAGVAVHNMFAPHPHVVDFDKNSWVLFSDPQIAMAGIDEDGAKKRGLSVSVETYDYAIDARAQIDKKTDGFLKFIIDNKTQMIIGVKIVSEDASSLVGEASLIVANKMTAMDLLATIHPHPTLSEAFGKLAQQIFFKMMMKKQKG